jgi:cytochrome c oxidase subunit 3
VESPVDTSKARIGIWLFILSEILLFGGLFLLYSAYRYKHAGDFASASAALSVFDGTLNTAILITSSLMVALAVHFLRSERKRLVVLFLAVTIALAAAFLVIKGFEWAEKFDRGLYPGSPELLARPPGVILYFGLYFIMTGLHALHVLVGLCIFTVVIFMTRRGRIAASRPAVLENSGLYWHLVDIIWIFLFPLFYLIA